MKKRILSLMLTVALTVGIIYPALQIGAKAVNDKVMISATASDNITIQKPDELPEEGDFDGVLSLSSGTFSIERDYAQKAIVNVTNTSEANVEYYLVAKNIYKDIYMNFVRNGSTASPLVIRPGETQSVQLDIFAQNAEQGEYTIPVYAMVIKGDSEVEDAKSTMTLTCDITELKMSCNEISSNKSTLAKTLRLTNRGGALTDVTLSFEGDLADYVQLNPIVSNYQMNSGSSVEVKAIPDLTKMKNNNVSAISGKLVASSGGQKATFDLTFDTKGEEITSTTMGELALKQSGNPYYNLMVDKTSAKESGDYNRETGELDLNLYFDMLYGDNHSEKLSASVSITGQPFYGDSSDNKPEVTTFIDETGTYNFKIKTVIKTEDLEVLASQLPANLSVELNTQSSDLAKETTIEVCFQIADAAGDLVPAELSIGMTLLEGVDTYGKYVAVNCTPYYSNEQKDKINAYLTAKSVLLACDVASTALSVMFPGVGTVAGLVCGIFSTILGNMVDAEIEELMKNHDNSYASKLYKLNGYQCTNAGSISNRFYINDYIDPVKVTGVSVSPSRLTVNTGESASLSATVRPENATNKSVRWESEDPDIASVSGGVVRGLKKGVTTIRAITVDGGYRDYCIVTVRVPVKGVTVEPSVMSVMIGDTFSLNAVVTPSNASNKSVSWSSSNKEIVEVDRDGTITAKATGDAIVTVKTHDGDYTDSCNISVYQPELDITVTPENLSVPKGGTGKLSVSIDSDTEKIASVGFASLNEDTAVIDADGNVNGLAVGTANIKITVKTQRGGTYTVTKAVKIHTPVDGVTIINNDQNLNVGEKVTVSALVGPSDAGNQNIIWSSDNNDVVSVDENGVVTAISEGTATITVTTEEGGFTDSITCTVTEFESESVGDHIYITSRMYGGDGVNKWYGSDDPDYVDIQPTTYKYSINGVSVGSSFNSGVTDVAIAKLPADSIRYGAVNNIVCDYTTDPGHYFVNTDTQITMLYPLDTPVSYIGTPEELQDVRSLPDFAIYSENIYSSDSSVVIGNTATISLNVYNRGSMNGWFTIVVKDGETELYKEENKHIEAFSGETVSFDWTPDKELTNISVTLINVNEGLVDESNTDNNTATRTFKARTRVVPTIESITPDYATEGEGIVFATVSDYADVIKTEFCVDGVLYTGEVKSSVVDGKMRYWINDPSMAEGERTIKVVVTYATGNTTTATIEKSSTITVLDADWKNYEFVLDTSFSSPSFYIYNKKTDSYNRTYDVTRNGENCVLTLTKDMYDNPADYILFVSCYNGFAYKNLIDKTTEFDYEAGNTLEFVGNDNIYFSSITYKSFDGNAVNVYGGYNSSVSLTPAKYCVEVRFTCYGENKTANLEVDLTEGDKTVDLASLISKYTFEFADEIDGTPSARMFYRYGSEGYWNSFVLKQSLSDNTLTCVVSDYNIDAFNNASEAFILITTNDSAFVTDVKPETTLPEVISLDKSKLQKYSLNAGDEEISYVKVDCERFNIHLYSTTVYLQPGEYDITIVFSSDNVNTEGFLSSQAVDSETAEITLDWSDAYRGKGAYVYALSETGKEFTVESYKAGTAVEVEKDRYSVKTNIVRNNSYYTVESTADASDGDAKIDIGNRFEGKITNTFGTIDGGSTIRIYLDDLTDKNGNTLTYFNSKDADDNLIGYITFTDVSDKLNTYSVYVSLDNVSSFDVRLPDVSGTYSVSLEAMTENETVRDVSGIELDISNITLALGQTYKLTAGVYPENAINKNVTWKSSNPDIVSVDENGNITASKFSDGTVYITATTEDGEYSATCKVTVRLTWWQTIIKFILLSPVYRCLMELI